MTAFNTPKTGPLTPEYERGFVENFGEKADPYCPGCGRIASFCECPHPFYGFTCKKCNCSARPEQLVRFGAEHEHRGECPKYVSSKLHPDRIGT